MSINGLKWGDLPAPAPIRSVPPRGAMTLPDGSDDDERRRWVEIVRAEVEAGTYHIDSRIVAERLIERGVIDAGDEQ